MKTTIQFAFIAFVFAGMLSLSSCKKDLNVIYVIDDHEVCLPALPNALANGTSETFTVSQASMQAAFAAVSADYSADKVKSMVAKGFKLEVSGSSVNLDGISGAQVYVKETGAAGIGNQIAYTNGTIPAGSTEVELGVNGTDLRSLLSASSLDFTVIIFNNDNSPAKCVKLSSGTINFEVKQ